MTNLDWLLENISKTNEYDCLTWPFSLHHRGKYGQIWYNGTTVPAHCVSFEITYGYRPEVVRHKCDNPPCINPHHLLAGTQADNIQDRVDRGRGAHSEKHGRAVLTIDQVKEVYFSSEDVRIIATRFGIDPKAIRDIRNNVTWKRVTSDLNR